MLQKKGSDFIFNKIKIGENESCYKQLFQGKENKITADKLKEGYDCIVIGYGQSMTPLLRSGQAVIVKALTENDILKKNNIVFCKVNGHYYLHKISAIKHNKRFQISNNHGHINGWISRNNIYGKVVKIL